MANIAVAILNYNGAEHLKRFLPSVIKYSPEGQVIVGDNASTDNSIQLLQESFPEVKVIKLAQNYGYAGGYNRLIEQIEADYIVLANSDVEVTDNWLPPLAGVLDENPAAAVVQPNILSYHNRKSFEYAGAGGGFIDKFGYPFCRGRIFASLEEDHGQYDDETSVFWASGACCMLKKSAFNKIGGFDESFFAHMEEIDLNWRLLRHGYEIKYTGKARVYHLGGGTLSYDNPRKTYLNFRNSWMTLIKNQTGPRRFKIFIVRYFLDLLSLVFFLSQFKAMSALAVLRAHFYLLRNFRNINRVHPSLAEQAKNNYKIEPQNFSIVWQYFVRHKKKYSDL